VETEDQFGFLQRHKCDHVQGYLFSAPLPIEEVEPFLIERKAMIM
jgi:EAL domain-containing protein (putative c-di-GMP-specific phosphodiesterase class I)